MTKIVVLFGQPKDPKLFDEQYWKDHVPIAKAMPGLRNTRFTRSSGHRGENLPTTKLSSSNSRTWTASRKLWRVQLDVNQDGTASKSPPVA